MRVLFTNLGSAPVTVPDPERSRVWPKVVVVDVTDDYALMQPPLPTECYPVLREFYLPRYGLSNKLSREDLIDGYLYDWHEGPDFEGGLWYVGVVRTDLAMKLLESAHK